MRSRTRSKRKAWKYWARPVTETFRSLPSNKAARRPSSFPSTMRNSRPARRSILPCCECAPLSKKCVSRTPRCRFTSMAKPVPRSTFPTTSCVSCTASFTCSKTRRSSWRATSSVKPRHTSIRWRRHFSVHSFTTRRMVRIPGIARATRGAWRFSSRRSARCFTSFSARTCCVPTYATRSMNSANCSTTPVRWRLPNAMRRAFLTRITVSL